MRLTRRKTSKRKTKRGGSKIYNNSGLKNTNETFEGKQFFRKMTTDPNELAIAEILMVHPHPNIATIYSVQQNHIDMELLKPLNHFDPAIKTAMASAKAHLQSQGIMYVDWKIDNIGLATDGNYKLYNFDSSAIINTKTRVWTSKPPLWWSFGKATEKGLTDPYEIDNFSFKAGLTQQSS